MIEINNLRKGFGDTEVLNSVDSTFLPAHSTFIIGRSGSGKTVLLKTVLGLFRPDEGEVLYHGKSMASMSKEERMALRQEVGMVFQGGALFDSLTVEENVMFPLNFFSTMSNSEK